MLAFLDCLWRGNYIFVYCDLFRKSLKKSSPETLIGFNIKLGIGSYAETFFAEFETLILLNFHVLFNDLKSYKCDKSAALPTGLPLILPNLIGVVSTMPWWCYKVYLSESPFLILTSCQYLLFTETDDSGSPTQWHFCIIPFNFF